MKNFPSTEHTLLSTEHLAPLSVPILGAAGIAKLDGL